MKPLDPRLLQHASAARRFVVVTAALATLGAGLLLLQAQLLANGITQAFLGRIGLEMLWPVLAGLVAVVIARAVLAWASEVAAHRASAEVIGQLRARLAEHVLRLGPRHPDLPPSSELATLAGRGLDGLAGYFSRYLPTLLVAAVVPTIIGVRILLADWLSAVIIGVTVPLIPIFMILIGLHTERETRRQWRALAVLGNHFLDLVAGLDVLIAFGRARRQSDRLRALAEQYRTATMRTLRVAFLSALALELLATLSVAVIAVSIGLRLVSGHLDLATALLVLILAPEVYLPLRAVGARFHDCAEGLAAANDVFAVLELPTPTVTTGRVPAPDPSRVPIRLQDVHVRGRGREVLHGFDLCIAPGSLVGVSGGSGAGKSTLLDLLLGLRTPDAGVVSVGGVDLADIDPDAWRRRVSWVPQRPVLMAGTVAQNIRLADPHATPRQVRDAAAAAALDVALDTEVGDDGHGLSTGQRRRVALARAVLADRPLLLLDEPTEGVDADTEAAITAALPRIAAGRTVILVTHRPALLAPCDRHVTIPTLTRDHLDDTTGSTIIAGSTLTARSTTTAPPPQAVSPEATRPHSTPDAATNHGALRYALAAAGGQWVRLVAAVLLGGAALGCGVALTATSAWLISTAALHPPVLSLMVAIVAVRAFGLGKGVLRYAERLVSHDTALRAATELRAGLWQALVRLGSAATARQRRGELLSRLIADVDAQQDLLVRVLVPVAAAWLVCAITAAGLWLLLPTGGAVATAGVILAAVVAPVLSGWAAWRSERRTADARGEASTRTVEIIDAAPDLLVFRAAGRYLTQLREANTHLTELARRAATARGLGTALSVFAVGATSVAATAAGVAAVRAGTLPGPALAVLALTPLALADVVSTLPDAALRLLTAVPAAHRLVGLHHQPIPAPEPLTAGPTATPRSLAAEAVSTRWPGADRDAVRNADLDLPAGTRLVITGTSGAGKTTLLATLMRELLPRSGRVLADGRDTRELTGDQLRAGIAWCGPWTHLFDSTLRANLQLAAPHADDEQLVHALKAAQLGDWLAGLPDGLDTALGAHGGPVSGGERQRLGIARALLAQRPVLVLDEPTAHLDPATATALAAELMTTTHDRTALLVTHRPELTPGLPVLRLEPPAHTTSAVSASTHAATR